MRDSEKLIQRETETVRLWRQRGRDKKKDNERGRKKGIAKDISVGNREKENMRPKAGSQTSGTWRKDQQRGIQKIG